MEREEEVAMAFDSWLSEIDSESIPETIVAVNLGLFETPGGYTAYLTGSCRFDPDDDTWACSDDFVPRAKDFPLTSTFPGVPWPDVLIAYRRLLESYLAKHPQSPLHRVAAITVGFDDGDLERVQ